MKTYRIFYRMAPEKGPMKHVEAHGNSMSAAFYAVEHDLHLKYPHFILHHIDELQAYDSDPQEIYREVEGRR